MNTTIDVQGFSFSSQIESLRRRMAQERDFEKIIRFFVTQVMGHDAFSEESCEVSDPMLEEAVQRTVAEFIPRDTVRSLRLWQISRAQFIHGSFVFGRGPGFLFYFRKDKQGIMCLGDFYQRTGVNIRFTVAEVEVPEGPTFFQGGPRGQA